MQSFTVPGRPVPKGRPRLGRGGHTHTPQTTIDYQQTVREHAALARIKPIEGPVALRLRFFGASRGDGDNLAKAVADALNGVAYADDKQIVVWHIYVVRKSAKPYTSVELRPLDVDELIAMESAA